MDSRHFFLSIPGSGCGTLPDEVSVIWHDPYDRERFYLNSCFLARLDSYRLARYNPLFRTLSPGMTVHIFQKIGDAPLGRMVFPVKGIPRLEWFVH